VSLIRLCEFDFYVLRIGFNWLQLAVSLRPHVSLRPRVSLIFLLEDLVRASWLQLAVSLRPHQA
jgi:hypothetical protein